MKSIIFSFSGIVCLLISVSALSQTTIMDLKDLGEEAYEDGRYREAVKNLEKFDEYRPQNLDVLTALGISFYHVNRVADGLDKMLLVLNNDRRPEEKLHYYVGRSYHHLENFEKAAKYYKNYIREGSDEKLIAASKAHLLRCDHAQKIVNYEPRLYVDNMGNSVNSVKDDFYPVTSPTSSNRLYFSSQDINNSSVNDSESKNRKIDTDLFATSLTEGVWKGRKPMNPALNTAQNEILYDFSLNGQVAYYFSGENRTFGKLYTDTFNTEKKSIRRSISIPADPKYGDQDIQFINDTTIVFASIRDEGYGGYDLYVSQYYDGKWSKPRNLGNTVNTPYNERGPHISNDCLTLVFSSDRPKSIGGYDFFIGKWDDKARKYRDIENAGKPLNSPGNDLFFTMSLDGVTSYFSSDRKTGKGGYDLFTGYFKSPLSTTQTPFPQIVTHLVHGPDSTSEAYNKIAGLNQEDKEITLNSILYSDGNVLSRTNKNTIDEIADIMNAYPETQLRIQVFANNELNKSLDLYFSVKTGEQIADYLKNKGINGNRIQITGCGSSYPLALSRYIGGGNIPEEVNSRVDFKITNTENYPINITYSLPDIPSDADRSAYDIFNSYFRGLSYRIQITALSQKYSSPILMKEDNPLITTEGDDGIYKYTLGLFNGYQKATDYRKKLVSQGISDAFIVPYINGMRMERSELKQLTDEYPDLKNYFNNPDGK